MDKELQSHIRSGEFTFCGRCGIICRLGKEEFMCTRCKASLFSKKETKQQADERYLIQACERDTSAVVEECRENLAKLRRGY